VKITRLLAGCGQKGEERRSCTRATKRFLSVSKTSTVPEAVIVLPTQLMFLRQVKLCLDVPRGA